MGCKRLDLEVGNKSLHVQIKQPAALIPDRGSGAFDNGDAILRSRSDASVPKTCHVPLSKSILETKDRIFGVILSISDLKSLTDKATIHSQSRFWLENQQFPPKESLHK